MVVLLYCASVHIVGGHGECMVAMRFLARTGGDIFTHINASR